MVIGRFGGIVDRVFALSAEGQRFDLRPGQVKDSKIDTCCFPG